MTYTTMGACIAHARREKGLTQEALANLLGVTNQAVSKWESDTCCPDIMLLPRLADALGLTLDALFGREAAEPVQSDTASADLPWPDDDDLHAALYQGHRLLMPRDGTARFDRYDELRGKLELHFSGSVRDIFCDFDVVCGDVQGCVNAGGDLTCAGIYGTVADGMRIEGDVTCAGALCCGDIGGDVECSGSVSCGDIGGDVECSGDVCCGSIGGDVECGGNVCCGSVGGDVTAESMTRQDGPADTDEGRERRHRRSFFTKL